MLTGNEIEKRVKGEHLTIVPFFPDQVNPASYNLRLGPCLATYNDAILDMRKENPVTYFQIPNEGYVLLPGELYLGSTLEYTESPGVSPKVEGRSSVGRLGLFVHVTAGFGDPGFKGHWTLEIVATKPVRVYAGVEICQIVYGELTGVPARAYNGKYQDQENRPRPSGLFRDFLRRKQFHDSPHCIGPKINNETEKQ